MSETHSDFLILFLILLFDDSVIRHFSSTPSKPTVSVSSPSSPPSPPSSMNNVTPNIQNKVGRNLHLQPGHPLTLIKKRIAHYFKIRALQMEEKARTQPASPTATSKEIFEFTLMDRVPPQVSVYQNFDSLLFPADHPGRSISDTFYYSPTSLLRTHTTAHELDFLKSGLKNFLVAGDCYRRDEIDASHYPVFHQMEGVRIFAHDTARYNRNADGVDLVVADLKSHLEGLIHYLFADTCTGVRWIEGSFPFTHPSFEMEIEFQGKWLEVLGCGVLQYPILDACEPALQKGIVNGWAFGLGLERMAMILFEITDIRLFWSEDKRFTEQFDKIDEKRFVEEKEYLKQVKKFQIFSKYPMCFKDVSFWIPNEIFFNENDLCSLIRENGGDLIEKVSLHDSFQHPVTKQQSKCYRIMYRSLVRNLTNEEIDVIQEKIRKEIAEKLGFKLR